MVSRPRSLHVTASGTTREVAIDSTGHAAVEGVAEPVEIHRLDRTTFRAVVNGRRILVRLVETDEGQFAFADGCSFTIDVDTPTRLGRPQRRRAPDLSAPMPATVVTVLVDTGQTVQRGDVLVVLEAMKMELTLRAPHDGTVDAVACQPGELVQPGVPLVTIRPADDSDEGQV